MSSEDTTTKYEVFVSALRELCKAHGVMLCPSSYDMLQVWDLHDGENAICEDGIEDRTK